MAAKTKKKEQNLKEMGLGELENLHAKSREELFKLKFRAASAPLKNTMQIRFLKRTIARVNTFINQQRRKVA